MKNVLIFIGAIFGLGILYVGFVLADLSDQNTNVSISKLAFSNSERIPPELAEVSVDFSFNKANYEIRRDINIKFSDGIESLEIPTAVIKNAFGRWSTGPNTFPDEIVNCEYYYGDGYVKQYKDNKLLSDKDMTVNLRAGSVYTKSFQSQVFQSYRDDIVENDCELDRVINVLEGKVYYVELGKINKQFITKF